MASTAEGAVVVGMEVTPRLKNLTFVREEISSLEPLFGSMKLQVSRPLPTQEDVLLALRDCKIFHFAGHGLTSPLNPSKNCLLLEDWEQKPLTVQSLFDTNFYGQKPKPILAYLSACGTGRIENDELLDEGLHLISACQLAGFRHLIGTLWEVNDKSCIDGYRVGN